MKKQILKVLTLLLCGSGLPVSGMQRAESVSPNLKSEPKQMTQTQAYLSVPVLRKEVEGKFSQALESAIVKRCLDRESKHKGTHYVFYHAQKSLMRLVQDFFDELYSLVEQSDVPQAYHFLRFWPRASVEKTVYDFLQKTARNGQPTAEYDNSRKINQHLLPVNLSLFGNTMKKGEGSWWYFNGNRSIRPPNLTQLFEEIFNILGFDKRYITKLLQTNSGVLENSGTLLQIFIPKEKVDDLVYLSVIWGKHFNVSVVDSVFDKKRRHHIKISPVLEKYKNSPSSIADIDMLQGRILLTAQGGLLDPNSGCKIYRETKLPVKKLGGYQRRVAAVVQEAFADWVKKQIDQESNELPSLVQNSQLGKNIEFFRGYRRKNKQPIQSKL